MIYSQEGDPHAMAMYAVGILPLILQLESEAQQIWYRDGSSAGGKLDHLHRCWDKLSEIAQEFGYFVNAVKSILIVKEEFYQEAKQLFEGSKVRITTSGSKYLGSTIENVTFREAYMAEKV